MIAPRPGEAVLRDVEKYREVMLDSKMQQLE